MPARGGLDPASSYVDSGGGRGTVMADTDQQTDIAAFVASTRLFRELDPTIYLKIADAVEVIQLEKDDVLYAQGDPSDGFFLIREGQLSVTSDWKGEEKLLAEPGPRQTVGEISLMGDRRRTATARAKQTTVVYKLHRDAFAELTEKDSKAMRKVVRRMADRQQRIRFRTVMRASRIFKDLGEDVLTDLESEMKLRTVASGETLCRQGEPADSLFVVISGRLRIWLNRVGGGSLFLNEVGPGDSVGEMGVITASPRAADVRAIRDTTVAEMPKEAMEKLLRKYPEVINRLFVRIVVGHFGKTGALAKAGSNTSNTFALIPVRSGVPVNEVGQWLGDALRSIDSTLVMTSQACDERFGSDGFAQTAVDHPSNAVLIDWLNEQEFANRYIIYVADDEQTNWTRRCVRQADHVLFVADSAGSPEIGQIEGALLEDGGLVGVRKSLVLLHPEDTHVPSGTVAWLAARKIGNHYHVRRRNADDFARLTRFLTGRAVALVLGGGGARGFAHVGIIRALNEAGIPIDLVGGASMGALIAAECAMQWETDKMLDESLRISVVEKEVTIPLVSLFRGRKVSREIFSMCGGAVIEDLWRRYFSVSCNLSRARVMVHDSGSVADAVLTSNTPPGLFPPQVLDGDLLVDGGLLNNVPLDVMERYNEGGKMIAVDVNPKEDLLANDEYEFGLSGTKVLMSKMLPFVEPMNVPNIMDIIARSTAIGGLAKRMEVMESGANLYLQPPVERFPITGHKQAREIAEVGYDYAKDAIAEWLAAETTDTEAVAAE